MARTLVFGNNCCMVCTTGHTIFKADIWLNGFLATVSSKLISEYNWWDQNALWRLILFMFSKWLIQSSIKLGANLDLAYPQSEQTKGCKPIGANIIVQNMGANCKSKVADLKLAAILQEQTKSTNLLLVQTSNLRCKEQTY